MGNARLQTSAAIEKVREAIGPYGWARTIRYVDTHGHFRLEYRVGTYRRGKFVDHGRGTSYEAAIGQMENMLDHSTKPLPDVSLLPKEARELLGWLMAERDKKPFNEAGL